MTNDDDGAKMIRYWAVIRRRARDGLSLARARRMSMSVTGPIMISCPYRDVPELPEELRRGRRSLRRVRVESSGDRDKAYNKSIVFWGRVLTLLCAVAVYLAIRAMGRRPSTEDYRDMVLFQAVPRLVIWATLKML
jgi:hypothetical protein